MSINRSAVLLSVIATAVGVALGSSVGYAGSNPTKPVAVAACYHYNVSQYWCPDSSMFVRTSANASYELVTVTREGRRVTRIPEGVDAIFLTKDATEKFLLSYYWATNKVKAEELMRALSR